jgi:hypothetical protein
MASSTTSFLDHTQRRATVGRTLLDECFRVSIVYQIIVFFTRMCRDTSEEPRGGSFIEGSEKQAKEGSGNGASPSMGALRGEPKGREGAYTEDTENYVKEGSGDGAYVLV